MKMYSAALSICFLVYLLLLFPIMHIAILIPYPIVSIILMVIMLLSVPILGFKYYAFRKKGKIEGRKIAPGCFYNPLLKALEIHMNDEAYTKIKAAVTDGILPAGSEEDPIVLRKEYLNGIRLKLIAGIENGLPCYVVAHNLNEIELLKRVPGVLVNPANRATTWGHSVGIHTLSSPRTYPPAMKELRGIYLVLFKRFNTYVSEIQPAEIALNWLKFECNIDEIIETVRSKKYPSNPN